MPAAKRNFRKRHMHGIPHLRTALPPKRRNLPASSLDDKGIDESEDTPANSSPAAVEGDAKSGSSSSASHVANLMLQAPQQETAKIDATMKTTPQSWIDLYHSRPTKLLTAKLCLTSPSPVTKRWLQSVLAEVDPNIANLGTTHKDRKMSLPLKLKLRSPRKSEE